MVTTDENFRTGLLVWSCGSRDIHKPHDHEARVAAAIEPGPVHCPGVEQCTDHLGQVRCHRPKGHPFDHQGVFMGAGQISWGQDLKAALVDLSVPHGDQEKEK